MSLRPPGRGLRSSSESSTRSDGMSEQFHQRLRESRATLDIDLARAQVRWLIRDAMTGERTGNPLAAVLVTHDAIQSIEAQYFAEANDGLLGIERWNHGHQFVENRPRPFEVRNSQSHRIGPSAAGIAESHMPILIRGRQRSSAWAPLQRQCPRWVNTPRGPREIRRHIPSEPLLDLPPSRDRSCRHRARD